MTARVAKEEIAILMPTRLTHYFTDDTQNLPEGASETGEMSVFARVAAAVAALRERLAARRARSAAVTELARLSDHELSDIGLVRSDLLRVNDPGFVASHNAERAAASVYGLQTVHARG